MKPWLAFLVALVPVCLGIILAIVAFIFHYTKRRAIGEKIQFQQQLTRREMEFVSLFPLYFRVEELTYVLLVHGITSDHLSIMQKRAGEVRAKGITDRLKDLLQRPKIIECY